MQYIYHWHDAHRAILIKYYSLNLFILESPGIPRILADDLIQLAVINLQGTTVLVVLLLVLLSISFVVSGAEVAFFSLTYKDINLLKTKQQHSYKRIVDLLEDPKALLASLLIANSLANIGIIIIANMLMDIFIFDSQQLKYEWIEFAIKVSVVTSVLVLFGEVMPKVFANQNNIRFAKDFGIVAEAVYYLFNRVGRSLIKYSDLIENKLAKNLNGSYGKEERRHAIDLYAEKFATEKEKDLLLGIESFGEVSVKQIMRTRLDVSGIQFNTTFPDLIKRVEDLHYSRLPVYKEDLDEVVGMIHTKDLLPYLEQPAGFDWHTLMRPPYFVHEQKLIEDLLKEFQSKRIHFAVVVDEFGGTSGIVTLEDVMEEIIGDIKDEFDEEDIHFRKLDSNNYVFEGKIMIHDVCKAMELPPETFDTVKGESDSLAGLVLEIAGDIPAANQVITSGDFDFTVLEKEKNRLKKIKITIRPLQ
ncbi:gliding motility-associated protein GldE [Foetidibacter luteolus]|uniref:gliding motility-associated protein GldE n=1 Tax=Foetidibacter luteolus TaxID=2608880 RepID=UPI001F22F935|nr:gliding motility-associated protein GldE [Foetidibacter luteolus]